MIPEESRQLEMALGLAEVDFTTAPALPLQNPTTELLVEVEGDEAKKRIMLGLAEVGILENAGDYLGPRFAWKGDTDDFRLVCRYIEANSRVWTFHLADRRS